MTERITITDSSDNIGIISVGTQGPAASTDSVVKTGTVTLAGTSGTDVTFSSALTDADYVVLYEQQALSGKAKFESRSIGEISTENKTVNGFTVKSSDNLIGVTVRYAVITY